VRNSDGTSECKTHQASPEIIADRFHVMKQVTLELDEARREAKKMNDESEKEMILATLYLSFRESTD